MAKTESIGSRYLAKIIGNALGGAGGFLQQMVLTRALGPGPFGDFVFIQNHLLALLGGFELGAGPAYFARISQDRKAYPRAAAVYALVILTVCAGVAGYAGVVASSALAATVWPGIAPMAMLLGLPLGIGNYLAMRVVMTTDAGGIARSVEYLRVGRTVLALLGLGSLALAGALTLGSALLMTGVTFLLFVGACAVLGHRTMGSTPLAFSRPALSSEWRYFFRYARPLAVSGVFSLCCVTLERWLLQAAGGSVQQGFFGVATYLGTLCFLLTGSMSPVFFREVAAAFAEGDKARVRTTFAGNMRLFFAVSAIPSLFFALNARSIVLVVNGPAFEAAWLSVAVYALYPIHQTYGQFSTSLMLATNRTKNHMVISVVSDAVGMVLVYLFVASPEWIVPGLGLGALGMSLRGVLAQLFSTTLLNAVNYRYIGMSFSGQLMRDALCLSTLAGVAAVAALAGPAAGLAPLASLIISGAAYGVLVVGIAVVVPSALGLERADIERFMAPLRRLAFPGRLD